MARLENLPPALASHLAQLPCPEFATTPWAQAPPLQQARVAIVSTAGLHRREDAPFTGFSGEYRVIPGDAQAADLVMSHISTNFDRSGFQRDWNLVFPLDRLRELAAEGTIASLADFHYSFMGATDPAQMEGPAAEVAGLLQKDRVNAVLLVPV
ncbi:MAG: selenoprotein B glycine/betaine/sarcosine/D-proline reductase [Desulfarculus sp.]|nr:MAG: selenoprotein B glycine/betaine/sarcosine/D-proline reductase [Desulfarculus sp.]